MLPPSDEQEAFQLVQRMESYYSDAFDGFDEDEIFYEGKLDEFVEPPEGFDITIPTTARAVVDEAVDNITPADILVHYQPRGGGRQPEEDADAVRSFSRALWKFWRTKSDHDIVRDFEKNAFMSGMACYKLVIDRTLWPELAEDVEAEILEEGGHKLLVERSKMIEAIRAENTPLFCRSLPPSCIMVDPTPAARKLWIIERYESMPEEAMQTYAFDDESLRQDYWQRAYSIHEVWTASFIDPEGRFQQGKHWVFVNWQMVVEEDNIYHDLPYVVKYSGFGREAFKGKPEYKAVGFYTRQVKSMFLAEMRRHMQFDAIMTQVAFPIAFIDESAHDSELDFSPGSVNYVSLTIMENIDKMWVKAPIPDAEYLSSLNAISQQIERGTVQRALRGAGVPGTDSAAQLGMIGGQARLRVESVKMATEQAMAEITSLALKFIDKVLQAKVSIFGFEDNVPGYTLGPKQIKGHYRVGVEFKPNEDAIKERKLILANEAISKGGLSRYDAYTFAGFDRPWDLIDRKDADDLMQEPLIKRAMAKRTLKAWGVDVQELEDEERMEQMQQQLRNSQIAQEMQIGTPVGGDPMSPDGNPANAGPLPPAATLPSGGDGGLGLPVPGGAPPAVAAAPVAGLMNDLSALSAGVQ